MPGAGGLSESAIFREGAHPSSPPFVDLPTTARASVRPRSLLRDQLLADSSVLRVALERLPGTLEDSDATEEARAAAAALVDGSRWALSTHLSRAAQILDRMTAVGVTLAFANPSGAEEMFERTLDGLGRFEQMLEWCLEGAEPDRQERLLAELVELCPERWRTHTGARVQTKPSGSTAETDQAERGETPELDLGEEQDGADPETELQRELIVPFRIESAETLQRCEELVVALEQQPGAEAPLAELFRRFHTLKGAAAAVGLNSAAAELHGAESLLESVRDGRAALNPEELADSLLGVVDSVRAAAARLSANGEHTAAADPGTTGEAASAPLAAPGAHGPTGTEQLNALVRELGEVAAGQRALRQQMESVLQLRTQLAPDQARDQIEDTLESLAERANQFSRLATELEARIGELGTLPMAEILGRLVRPVRDAARSEGKLATLKLPSTQIRIDRGAAERLHSILLHLVRNAVAHGIETPEVRRRHNKPAAGVICISAREETEQLVIEVADDGSGLDYAAILDRARERGWIGEEAPALPELACFIFSPGFSTRRQATELSGRGIGLDSVAQEVRELDGRVEVTSDEGRGATFRIVLPLARAALDASVAPSSNGNRGIRAVWLQ